MKIKRSHTSVRFKLSQAHSYYTKSLRLEAEKSQENERNQKKLIISKVLKAEGLEFFTIGFLFSFPSFSREPNNKFIHRNRSKYTKRK